MDRHAIDTRPQAMISAVAGTRGTMPPYVRIASAVRCERATRRRETVASAWDERADMGSVPFLSYCRSVFVVLGRTCGADLTLKATLSQRVSSASGYRGWSMGLLFRYSC